MENSKTCQNFLKYISFPTMSDENSQSCPSSEKQLALAKELALELTDLGLSDVKLDSYGYVYATLKSTSGISAGTSVGFIAHMDTSDAVSDENIKASIINYTGGNIVLNEEKNICMNASDYPCLSSYIGQRLIVTDGTTLLGADDKAGIAEIMGALEYVIKNNIPHSEIKIAFTPDEEIGRGADHFDVEFFGADYAYTIDGGALGEIEYENFNAASAKVTFKGVSIHPGSAKDKMINAARIACEFDSLLPQDEIPEKTENYEGFHHLIDISGSTENAAAVYIIRDHDEKKFEQKKRDFENIAQMLNKKYKKDTVVLEISDSYYNMKKMIDPHPYIIDRAKQAMLSLGISPKIIPIRGGTDGARLSFMGLPCPNLCTGGENFHSRFEFISIESMDKITQIIVKMIEDTANF